MQEEKEYFTLKEVAEMMGIKRTSLYYYIDALNIQTRRFPLNRNRFVARTDVERIRQAKEQPWKNEDKSVA